jgi:putative ABC transport system permease protein
MTDLLRDFSFAVRTLRRSPGFTAVVVLTLALGIGANSALYSIVNAALLRPLPFAHPDRLVSISVAGSDGRDMEVIGEPSAILLREHARKFDALASYVPTAGNFTGGAEPEYLLGSMVSRDFFAVFEVQPALGRTFADDELRYDGEPAVILSHSLWTTAFGADTRVLGRAVQLHDKSYTVVGVMPRGFEFPETSKFWIPLTRQPATGGATTVWFDNMIGRLRQGISVDEGRAELAALHTSRASELPPAVRDGEIRMLGLHERMYGNLRPALLVLLGTVGCVLLIACANVANLLLARAAARRREFAIRAALGAGRARIARQMLAESIVLAFAGGACGLLIPLFALDLLVPLGPELLTRVPGISVDGSVLAFTLIVSLITGLIFGSAPALAMARGDVHDALKHGGQRIAGGRGRAHPRRLLVTAQLALALVLLVGAGLLAKSFIRFRDIDPGFRPDGVLKAAVSLSRIRYPDPKAQEAFYRAVVERLRALPGVEAVAVSRTVPLKGFGMTKRLSAPPGADTANRPMVAVIDVSPGYFRTFGVPLRAGREFTDTDVNGAPPVAIISESMLRTAYLPEGASVGSQLTWPTGAGTIGSLTIVGIVPEVRQLGERPNPRPTVYLPLAQSGYSSYATISLRTRGDPRALAPALRRAVLEIDPNQPISALATMDKVLADTMAPRRFNALLLGAFAGLALVLAALGLYGLVAYLVAQRTHEIGVRVALGAERGDVLALVLRQGLLLIAGGVALGLLAAFGLTRLLASLLFEVTTTDPLVFIAVPLVLAAVAVLATLIPARRATRVDPMVALRAD